jgi:hypothetical protein
MNGWLSSNAFPDQIIELQLYRICVASRPQYSQPQ